MAFTDNAGFAGAKWIGIENFLRLLQDPVFGLAFVNSVKWTVVYPAISMAIGLAFAVALDRKLAGLRIYKSVFYIPGVLSLVAVSLIWGWIYQPSGLLNSVLDAFGLGGLGRGWLADPSTVTWAIMAAGIWNQTGFNMVLYLAGLRAVPGQLIEAAQVDGATPWQSFWRVTFPTLRPMHVIVLAGSVIAALKTFDIVWVTTEGGPFNQSDTLATYMYRAAFGNYEFGLGAAAAAVIALLSIGFIAVYLNNILKED